MNFTQIHILDSRTKITIYAGTCYQAVKGSTPAQPATACNEQHADEEEGRQQCRSSNANEHI